MTSKYLDDEERAKRIGWMLALEIARIVDDLEVRQVFLIDMWSKHRDRGPFLDTVYSRWRTLGFDDLALLPANAVAALDEFHRELEEFRFYFLFTEDMPLSLSEAYSYQLRRLVAYAEQAIEALGGTPERPVIEFPDEDPEVPTEVPADRPLLQLDRFEKPPEAADD